MLPRRLAATFLLAGTLLFGCATGRNEPADGQLTRLVKKIEPAVVTIVIYDLNHRVSAIGSGFFVDSAGNLITNYHVLDGQYSAEVRTADGTSYPIQAVVAENKRADLLKVRVDIPKEQVSWLKISTELPGIAEQVVVVGSPMGLAQTVSEGIVSSIREMPAIGTFFQISAPISPGSSGSPVINMKGQVVGVATFQFVQGQNLNFAVSAKEAKELKVGGPSQSLAEWTYNRSQQKPKLAEELCRRGFEFSINGQNQKALEYYKLATQKDPKSLTAWYGLGSCYVGLNNPQDALETYRHAVQINPDDENAHLQLANYLSKLGRYDEAIASFKEAVRINSKFEPAYFNLGVLYSQLGMLEDGKAAFEAVIRLNPDAAAAYYNIGITYTKMSRYKDAIDAYKQVLRLQPDFAPAYHNLGVVYGMLGRHDEELDAYKQAIRVDPEFVPAHYNIGNAYLKRGDKAAALEEYKILKEIDQKAANQLFQDIYK
jgi:tetratricopeptide (TPR) repeat protein